MFTASINRINIPVIYAWYFEYSAAYGVFFEILMDEVEADDVRGALGCANGA